MSPTQMETNYEPRRKNFTAHENGTQSNSELTHPQMPLAQSMLEQSEVRQQRNQACKAHNVAKCASQKEQQKWMKAELPDNVHGMRPAVHAHCLFLLKVRDKDFSSLQNWVSCSNLLWRGILEACSHVCWHDSEQ
ncbi:hypothetical protein O181_085387 [Austropuccinia psidii MF-1]|uniref:Uncharacterized protein n=1 Tax=Austropuccinia psidii MF-1 TaxID=1389203 RepID=A0A9Q3FXY5_9BASI|nr:hypothetical protein [Austropuccinia psidii MF-1]